jgi:nucleoside-diphosphate-sugar epimerase
VKRSIAITGATGFLGSALVHHFLSKGDSVIAIVRKIPQQKIPDVHYVLFDLSNGQCSQAHILADALIHTAYVAADDSRTALIDNIDGTKALLTLFPLSTKKIFISSVSADRNSRAVYGQQKAEVEHLFLEQNGTAIRPGLIIGNGGLFARMRDHLRTKKNVPVFSGGKQPLQTVFVDDLVRAIDQLIEKDLKGVLTFCEHDPVHYKEFYAELCRQLKVTPRFISIPYWVAGCMVTCATAVGITLPINRDNLQGLQLMRARPSKEDADAIGVTPGTYKENLARAMQSSFSSTQ